ncbi:uncharacterized protein LOC110464027 [Mizuhopecten yessoensis]|uniref:uncharacterized protein LOC110464027 n=1 Tax=Mizuhopecten yessoensis TaxID=6573 RepID=UPI000B457FC7|nr:uncharacterized protein LOC110464027 [Mizuhopecten yessoensis]
MARICKKIPNMTYVPHPTFCHKGIVNRSPISTDGLHLKPAGIQQLKYDIWDGIKTARMRKAYIPPKQLFAEPDDEQTEPSYEENTSYRDALLKTEDPEEDTSSHLPPPPPRPGCISEDWPSLESGFDLTRKDATTRRTPTTRKDVTSSRDTTLRSDAKTTRRKSTKPSGITNGEDMATTRDITTGREMTTEKDSTTRRSPTNIKQDRKYFCTDQEKSNLGHESQTVGGNFENLYEFQSFNTYEEFKSIFSNWNDTQKHVFKIKSSTKMENIPDCPYRTVVYTCVHYGTPRPERQK